MPVLVINRSLAAARADVIGGTMEQPVISVRGEAHMEAEPEIAVISVAAEGYGDAVEKLESGAASVYPDIKHKERTERVAGYRGRVSAHVVIRDFTVLGELMARLAGSELVTVAGPWWSLRPDSPVHRQARIAAAQDATRRAGKYAQAFGGGLGRLIEAADVALLTGQGGQAMPLAGRGGAARAAARAGEPPDLDFEPVKQTVNARVEARFGMVLPDPSPQSFAEGDCRVRSG